MDFGSQAVGLLYLEVYGVRLLDCRLKGFKVSWVKVYGGQCI